MIQQAQYARVVAELVVDREFSSGRSLQFPQRLVIVCANADGFFHDHAGYTGLGQPRQATKLKKFVPF